MKFFLNFFREKLFFMNVARKNFYIFSNMPNKLF